MRTIISFDVFDTCLVRRCAVPTDVFVEVARRIVHTSIVGNWEQDFVAARITAEQRARAVGEEEVTLSEIWQQLVQMVPGLNIEAGVALEMEVEREWIRPNPAMLTRVNQRRSEGRRIVFTSDTSLPAEFIRERLEVYGFWQSGDGLYVSSEQRATKRTGALFARLLATEGVSARQVLHIGDDPARDGRVPKRAGLRTEFVMETRLQGAEVALLRSANGDDAFVHHLAGAMRESRLAANSRSMASEIVAVFLGPFILTWALWVIGQAKRDGIRRLYFFSRDGFLLCKACRLLVGNPAEIDCRYLEVSRQSLLLPSIDEVDKTGMPWLRRDTEIPRLGHLLAKLELSLRDLGPQLQELVGRSGEEYLLRTDHDWSVFWTSLEAAPVHAKILERSAKRREAALAYFRSAGLGDSADYAVVDLGWFLTGQRALSTILRHGRLRPPKTGYYLGLEPARYGPTEAGPAVSLFYRPPFDVSAQCSTGHLFRNVTLLEHLVGCANHGTVLRYELACGAESVPEHALISNETAVVYAELHDACLQFVTENRHLRSDLPSHGTVRAVLSVLLANFADRPKRTWVHYLSGIEAAKDQNNRDAQSLTQPYQCIEVIEAVWAGVRRRPMESVHRHWEAAARMRSGAVCRCLFDLLSGGYRRLKDRRKRKP